MVKAIAFVPVASLRDMNHPQQLSTWLKPAREWCKVNIDGGRRLQDGFATCGGVIRDYGHWISGFTKFIRVCSIVEELSRRNWVITFSHVRHKGNCVADRMACLAVTDDFDVRVFDVPLPMVEGLVLLEMGDPS
ncbi:hypothetical protein V6N11_012346 [Hibiscus sabdariffa]|uniref:RNase H type-1 domain-containing protein n=1 Tax=Hibiscus sabdariffa TaxID=183260 RepID=A0ABR2QB04_9ROSI